MAELKTRPTGDDVEAFLAGIVDDTRRADARTVCALLSSLTGAPPVLWGKPIVGFGHQVLRYDSGRELDWMLIGFSPRKANTTIYLSGGMDRYADLLAQLGKHTTGVGCLYLKGLADVDSAVLKELLARSIAHASAPTS